MNWTNRLDNKSPLESLYSRAPSLSDVRIHEVRLGWGLNNTGDLKIEEYREGVELKFFGQNVRIDCRSRFLEVEKLSGYRDSEKSEEGNSLGEEKQ